MKYIKNIKTNVFTYKLKKYKLKTIGYSNDYNWLR